MARAKWGIFGLAAALMVPVAALADATGFLSDLVSGRPAAAEFAGTWVVGGQAPAGSDIDHVVVTASGQGTVRIQVFGRCEARVCNWGALPARVRTDGPNSQVVRSLSADFNLGFALQHVTLHRLPGNLLRLDMVTEFTDGSDRHDYETALQLRPAGAPVASSAAAPTPATAATAAPVEPSVLPLAATAAPPTDDCVAIAAGHIYVAPSNGNWSVRDFLHVIQGFGPYRAAAAKGLAVFNFYRFDEGCHVGRASTNMTFFRASGEVPRQPMAGEDCTEVHPAAVAAVKQDDDWKVVEGARVIFDYGSDEQGAAQAVTVIKSLNLVRQCYYDRANYSATYWLSR